MASFNHEVDTRTRNQKELALVDTRTPWEVAVDAGRAFTVLITSITPTGANDYFFYMLNVSQMQMKIHSVTMRAASAETISLGRTGYVDTSGDSPATATPVNALHPGGSEPAGLVVAQADADLASIATSGAFLATMRRQYLTTANTLYRFEGGAPLAVFGPNTAMTLAATAGSIALHGTVEFYFEDI